MFVLQIADVTDILFDYSCNDEVVEIELLAYYQELDKTCIVVSATTDSGKKYVLKLINGESSEIHLEEKRSEFSEFLRNGGFPVPQKYICNNRYCSEKKLGNIDFLITVEDYYGKDVKEVTQKSAYELGRLLGTMHTLSYKSQYHLEFGNVYSALKSGKTEFDFIWGKFSNSVFDNAAIQTLSNLHHSKMAIIKKIWGKLPIAAVHGDLALTSNLMFYNNKYGIIDFNLSGDEPLLGDLLVTWYSSRYSDTFIRKVSRNDVVSIKNKFFSGYRSVRELTRIEEIHFDELSKIINGIYFNKFVANRVKQGDIDFGKKLSESISEHYSISDTTIDLGDELGLW